ncbi:MAG: hypothetical protein SCALA702_32820 [Melioribacteraceae bacterium]|nr:MAG: hypothetical protein SCALA702_32820 [Melioribacteraceae bacterium]
MSITLEDIEFLKSAEACELLTKYADLSPQEFSLKLSGKIKLPVPALATLLKCRQKAAQKLSGLPVEKMLFDTIPLEQASSTLTAQYKFNSYRGIRAVDITGGLGIDTLFLSDQFREVYHFEQSEVLSEIAKHNASIADRTNVNFVQGDSISMLNNFPDKHFDLLYVDPARRDDNRRSVDINYLKPDIFTNYEFLKSKARKLLFKLSPAFDIREAMKLFPGISKVMVVSVNDECRELLLAIVPGNIKECTISGVELRADSEPVSVSICDAERVSEIKQTDAISSGYLYESYCGISKSGLDFTAAASFNLNAAGLSDYYFYSTAFHGDFPGKVFEVFKALPYNVKKIKKELTESGVNQINVKAKGISIKPAEVTASLKMKNGGNYFLFIILVDKSYEAILAKLVNQSFL